MFQVPETFLNKLKCNLCDGYLNAKPVVVKQQRQICAKCYKILPQDEMEQCVRQISFEAIGSCLIFPCRYHQMGCDYTFAWNHENGHETECKKRYFTVPDVVTTNESITNNLSESTQLDQSCLAKGNTIKAGNSNAAYSDELPDECQNLINMNLEGSVQFKSTKHVFPASNECNNNTIINGNLVYENIYSTIPSISGQSKTIFECLNCNAQVDKSTKNVCLFRHISCNNCASDMCIACVKNLDGNSRIACKNASKGCQELLYQSDVGVHRDNCEFNEIACPIGKCDKKCVLQQLTSHLKDDHTTKIVLSNEIVKSMGQKDQNLVFLCHDGIFKCLYYYYITSVEIFVVYLGPCVKASDFYFKVSVDVNKKPIKKKLMCANWNNYMLASGINFDKTELQIGQEKPFRFTLDLKILRAK